MNILMNLLRTVLFITSFLIIGKSLHATNYFVDDNSSANDVYCLSVNGDNSNDGLTALTPKLSLTNLLSTYSASFSSGDTIFVDAGQFSDNKLSSPINGVVIQGAGMGMTNFVNGCSNCWFMYINDNNTTLSSMTLQNYNDQTGGAGQSLGILSGTTGVNVWFVQVFKTSTTSTGSDFPIIVQSGADVHFKGGGSMCNSWDAGGGIQVLGATTNVLIENYIIKGNYHLFASPACAGVWVDNGNVVIKNSIFEDITVDASTYAGAALYVVNGDVEVVDSKFDNNKTYLTYNSTGGTIYVGGGQLRLARSTISNHSQTGGSTSYGAGIGIRGGTVIIDTCIFESNAGSSSRGKDFYNNGGTVTINDTEFNSTSNQIGCRNGTTSISYSNTPSSSGSYSTGLSFGNNLAPRTSLDLTGVLPEYTGDCNSFIQILPVELVGFTAECDDGRFNLSWATVTEYENDYFIIEKSLNDINFNEVISISGAGNSQELIEYSTTDINRNNQTVYYRITQVDFNGKKTVFPSISVSEKCADSEIITMTPDLSRKTILLDYDLDVSTMATLMILDLNGKLLFQEEVFLQKTKSFYESKSFGKLKSGMYITKISGNHLDMVSKKFVVSN